MVDIVGSPAHEELTWWAVFATAVDVQLIAIEDAVNAVHTGRTFFALAATAVDADFVLVEEFIVTARASHAIWAATIEFNFAAIG